MDRRVVLARVAAVIAGVAAATMGVNAEAAFAGAPAGLQESGSRCHAVTGGQLCSDLFGGQGPLAPGGPAVMRQVALTFTGTTGSRSAGLYVGGYSSRGASSDPVCTASDPASKFDFTVSAGGRELYRGTLAGFAAGHHDPSTRLALPGDSGVLDRWAPGDTVTVDLAVSLDRSADDSDMGCTTDTQFTWFAE
jgi:hypothetical protein